MKLIHIEQNTTPDHHHPQPERRYDCFDKDLAALVSAADAPLIEDVIRYNDRCKARYGDNMPD